MDPKYMYQKDPEGPNIHESEVQMDPKHMHQKDPPRRIQRDPG